MRTPLPWATALHQADFRGRKGGEYWRKGRGKVNHKKEGANAGEKKKRDWEKKERI